MNDEPASTWWRTRDRLIQCLLDVREDVELGTEMNDGICDSVTHAGVRAGLDEADIAGVKAALSEALSGLGLNVGYPVPAPAWFRPDEKYRERRAYSMLPLWTGDYGHARIALLNRLIDHLHS